MVDLSSIRSARVLTDSDEVARYMTEINGKSDARKRVDFAQNEDDGRLQVYKSQPGAIFDMPSQFTMPGLDVLKKMADGISLPWDDGYSDRVIPWWASDERPDRHGDIVEQSWNFDDFKSNPVLLDEHAWDLPPIGNVLNWQVLNRNDGAYSGPSLLLLCLFATAEQSAVADTIFRLARAKILRTGSVGFYPSSTIIVDDDAERTKLGLGRFGLIFQNNNLIEFSTATVPANAGALQLMSAARRSGLLRPADIITLRESQRRSMLRRGVSNQKWKMADMGQILFWKTFFPDVNLEPSSKIDEPLDVIGLMKRIDKSGSRVSPVRRDTGDDDIEEGEGSPDNPEGSDNPEDPDEVPLHAMMGAMTKMLVNVHDKLSDHTGIMEGLHDKADVCQNSIEALHNKIDSLGSSEGQVPGKSSKRKTTNNPELDLIETMMELADR